ncbi:MAG: family 43 glycosylhydrolase [Bacteroidales bacterium]|nr:family 43 glycosylhydrolase [Bacteroidales bacterium]
MRTIYLLSVLTITLFSVKGQPPTGVYAGNPVIKGWYADPDIAVFDNSYWIFPTRSVPFEDGVSFDAFSSKNLVSWQKHERIIDTSVIKWARKAMWAPGIIEKDSKYFLFFSANDIQCPISPWWKESCNFESQYGGIGIAISDKPEGPYKDYLGGPIVKDFFNKAQPIDQFVFKDKDGQYYLIYGGWGHCNIGKLSDDFTSIFPFEDGTVFKEITPHGYVEGPVMILKDKKYYLMWSEGDWTGPHYKVAYAISDSLLGPFNRIGSILEQDANIATGAGHHSLLNIPDTDKWYIVYHRKPLGDTNMYHREICIDRLYFNADGTIKPVILTNEGADENELIK